MGSPIFKKTRLFRSDRTKFVGAYIPPTLFDYLELFCIQNGISKSDVINEVLLQWQNEGVPKETMIRDIADSVYDRYCQITTLRKKRQFQKQILSELLQKGYSLPLIDKILTKIPLEYDEKK